MSEMIFATSDIDRTLFQALLDAQATSMAAARRWSRTSKREPLTYNRLVTGSLALGRAVRRGDRAGRGGRRAAAQRRRASVATFFALQAIGRVPAMLNFTAGPASLKAACTRRRDPARSSPRAPSSSRPSSSRSSTRWKRRGAASSISRMSQRRSAVGAKLARADRRALRRPAAPPPRHDAGRARR